MELTSSNLLELYYWWVDANLQVLVKLQNTSLFRHRVIVEAPMLVSVQSKKFVCCSFGDEYWSSYQINITKYFSVQTLCDCGSSNACFGSIQEVHVLLFWRRILKFLQDLHWISYQIYITIIHSCVCKNILVPFLSALVVCVLKLWKNSRLWDLLFSFSYCLPVLLLESSHFDQAESVGKFYCYEPM